MMETKSGKWMLLGKHALITCALAVGVIWTSNSPE